MSSVALVVEIDKAFALLAYAMELDGRAPLSVEDQDALADQICEDEAERARLIVYLSQVQDTLLHRSVAVIMGRRRDRLKYLRDKARDQDAIYGVWGQRFSGGALAGFIAATAIGTISGGWALIAIGASALGTGVTSYARDMTLKAARNADLELDRLEEVFDAIATTPPTERP